MNALGIGLCDCNAKNDEFSSTGRKAHGRSERVGCRGFVVDDLSRRKCIRIIKIVDHSGKGQTT